MVTYERKLPRAWTVAEAKARLSEVLRRAEDEGPQRIGTRRAFVVVPARVWDERTEPRPSLGQWLVARAPGAGPLEPPPRGEGRERPGPFDGWTDDDWKALDGPQSGRERPRSGREAGE